MKYKPYSYSKITLFQKCPYAWKLAYIDKVKGEKHPSLELGSTIHELIAKYLKQLRERGEQSNHALLEQIIEEQTADIKEVAPFIPAIKNIVLPPGIKAGIELELAVDQNFMPCEYSDSAFLRGKIDFTYRIEDTVVIIDWKTNQSLPPQEIIDDDWQTRFYALLASCFAPEASKFVIELNYLRHQKVRKLEINRNEVSEVKKWIITNVQAIESEENFSPTPGDWCSLCGYLHLCPIAKSTLAPALGASPASLPERLPEKITTPDQAVRLAGALKVIDQLRTKIQDLLKEWITENGPVQLSGEVLGFHQSETVKWETAEEKAALAALLVKAGVDREEIWNLFSTSKTAVCSFLKRHNLKHLLNEALATGEKSVYERFCFRKSQ